MNNIVLIGNLANDPELSYVGELNKPITKFRLAVQRNYKNKEGLTDTDFINIVVWGKKAETCALYLQKGKLVAVDGSLRIDQYISSTGENKYMTKVEAHNIKFLDKSKNNTSNNSKYYTASEVFENNTNSQIHAELSEEDLPF
ncbi:MAG: single-stranded DNA-binding protein [Peptostreptococcaceae bacterium]